MLQEWQSSDADDKAAAELVKQAGPRRREHPRMPGNPPRSPLNLIHKIRGRRSSIFGVAPSFPKTPREKVEGQAPTFSRGFSKGRGRKPPPATGVAVHLFITSLPPPLMAALRAALKVVCERGGGC